MSKFTLSALVALSAALGSQSIYAQGQSSGEDTQRNQQQQQQPQPSSSAQSSSAQSSQPGQYSGSAAAATQGTNSSSSASSQKPSTQGGHFDVKNSSSQNSGAQSSSSGNSSTGAPGQSSSGSDQSRSSSATYNSQAQPGQQPQTSTSSNDAFKSDTSATGRLSTQSAQSAGQSGAGASSSAQGAPGSSESSSTRLNTGAAAGANVQVNQQHVTQFQNVFSTWRPGSNAEAQLTAAINAAAPGARIDRQYVTRFVTDFNAIIPRVQLSTTAQQRLATAFATVLSPSVQVTTLEPTLTEVRQTLIESGLSPIQAQTVACDLHLMAAQVHPNMLEVQVK